MMLVIDFRNLDTLEVAFKIWASLAILIYRNLVDLVFQLTFLVVLKL